MARSPRVPAPGVDSPVRCAPVVPEDVAFPDESDSAVNQPQRASP